MNPKLARQTLAFRRPNGADDETPAMKKALELVRKNPSLEASISEQTLLDIRGSEVLHGIELPSQAATDMAEAVQLLGQRGGTPRLSVRNPATMAVALGFLLLIGVLTWHFLGQAGVFPDEAIKIATQGAAARPDQFDPVEEKAGQLQDWFMLKGFDNFRVPPELANFAVIGVRIFKSDNEPIAQAVVSENMMFFYCFPATPFGIDLPEKSWRVTEADQTVLAIREEKGVCFMISFRGNQAKMDQFLRKVGQR
jgi:hypothetical protein